MHPYILNALAWLSNNLAFSFFIGMFFGVFIIDVVHSSQIIVKLKQFAEENKVVVKYESIKDHIRDFNQNAAAKYHFFSPFRSDSPLAEHLKAQDILFCMGNSDVPVGQYTQKILTYYQLDEAALAAAGVITYGSNVKEVTTQVTEGSVDAGVVYCTDAYSAGLTPVDEATKEMCGQVIYPAAVLKAAPNAEAAKEFLAYLQTDKAMSVFEGVGFSAV